MSSSGNSEGVHYYYARDGWMDINLVHSKAVQGRLVRRMATLMNDMILLPPGKSVVSGVRQAK